MIETVGAFVVSEQEGDSRLLARWAGSGITVQKPGACNARVLFSVYNQLTISFCHKLDAFDFLDQNISYRAGCSVGFGVWLPTGSNIENSSYMARNDRTYSTYKIITSIKILFPVRLLMLQVLIPMEAKRS